MEKVTNNMFPNNNHQNGIPQRAIGDKPLDHFYIFYLEKFDGMYEAWKAKLWLREIDSISKTIECNELEKKQPGHPLVDTCNCRLVGIREGSLVS